MLNETPVARNDLALEIYAGISRNLDDGYGNNPARDALAMASVESNCAVLAIVRLPVCSQAEEGGLLHLI